MKQDSIQFVEDLTEIVTLHNQTHKKLLTVLFRNIIWNVVRTEEGCILNFIIIENV